MLPQNGAVLGGGALQTAQGSTGKTQCHFSGDEDQLLEGCYEEMQTSVHQTESCDGLHEVSREARSIAKVASANAT